MPSELRPTHIVVGVAVLLAIMFLFSSGSEVQGPSRALATSVQDPGSNFRCPRCPDCNCNCGAVSGGTGGTGGSSLVEIFDNKQSHGPAGALPPYTELMPQFSLIHVCQKFNFDFWMAVPTTGVLKLAPYAGGNVQESLLQSGLWEPDETALVQTILTECGNGQGVMVDIGANSGYFTGMALNAGCRVHAFEPTAYHEPYIRTTAKLSGHPERLMLHQSLVSDKSGEKVPYDTWNVAHSQEKVASGAKLTQVPSLRPDDVVAEDVLYLKMDIEGFEPVGFRGLTKLLDNHVVRYILWEHTPSFYSKEDVANPPKKVLESRGYIVSTTYPGNNNFLAVHPSVRSATRDKVEANRAERS